MRLDLRLPLLLTGLVFSAPPLIAGGVADPHAGHGHHAGHAHHPAAARPQGATEVPALRILFPENGARVGTTLAVVFETPGDLARLTMSAAAVGTHLHVEADEVSLMPVENQLIRLGGHRYLFLFDMPVQPGERTIRVYWSDAAHRTIESSVQSVKVIAEGEKSAGGR